MAADIKYADRAVVNIEDDRGNYIRELHVTELSVRTSAPLKRVNVMRREKTTAGFTQGVQECSGSLKLPIRVGAAQYDFAEAQKAGTRLTIYVVRASGKASLGTGDVIEGVQIEEVSDSYQNGENDQSVSFQAVDKRQDRTRRL
jgi:hypothetical protein